MFFLWAVEYLNVFKSLCMYTLYEDPFLKGLSAASLICYNFFSTIVTIYVFIVCIYVWFIKNFR